MKQYCQPATVTDLREAGRIILAHGEVTGHAHEVRALESDPDTLPPVQYFEEPGTGRRILLALRPCALVHQEHGRITCVPDDARRGADGERDATGRLIGSYRQGDVYLHPIGLGAWENVQQREYTPQAIRSVED